ncbi:endonuclease MutS2 [Halobacillus locisalis]|uniref:Endonuclease MutS2 n=1 Tax=Halobacillus locisalis TaxID=220753 RepID=A0A838CX35_9BACI|nr:endonuclease MutS2 [Halobacillus locisalis]MBA2176484.1 endonuclease MutS2 [Halobacillus locisalis]
MNNRTFQTLEFNDILEKVSEYALTNQAKQTIRELHPIRDRKQLERWREEVSEAAAILNVSGNIPIHTLQDVSLMIDQGNKGLYIRPQQFASLLSFLDHCTKLKRFMNDKEIIAPTIHLYASSIADLSALEQEIISTIRHGQVDDHASKELVKIRKQIATKEDRRKERLEALSKKYRTYMQESHPVMKNGRYTLPIKRENRSKLKGSIVDQSASGATVFIEPEQMNQVQEEIQLLKMSEEQEVEQILYRLTAEVLNQEHAIHIAIETMHHYDLLFAKAKYSRSIQGRAPIFSEGFTIDLKEARHPLLGEAAVPLSIRMGESEQALLITGPNTGGKTVTLKTVGLLSLMAQSGVPIPANEGSELPIFQHILVDIGDGQSINENLSTFSSRLVNLIRILREANDHSLLLLDEIGSGTDPREGMGLATAILNQLAEKGSTILATTHYGEMKEYADRKSGFINGAMEFDVETLKPTYQLHLGSSGKSQAFGIAHKLGLHPKILQHAYGISYNEEKDFVLDDRLLAEEDYRRQVARNRYGRKKVVAKAEKGSPKFKMGDNVKIPSEEELGIIYTGPDSRGNYRVQVKGEKRTYNHKRLTLYIPAEELYPEDYDFDIIFKSKEYRKLNKQLDKKHVEGQTLEDEE